jgi:hypothetical protein
LPKKIEEVENDDLGDIGTCLSGIAEANEKTARKLVPSAVRNLNEFNNLKDIGSFLTNILDINKYIARKLIKKMDLCEFAKIIIYYIYLDHLPSHLNQALTGSTKNVRHI